MRSLLFLCFAIQLFGVMAFSGWQTYHQDDGTTFEARVQGDEYFHWMEAKDGSLITYNKEAQRYERLELNETAAYTSHQKYSPAKGTQFRSSPRYNEQSKRLQKIWKKRRSDYEALRKARAQTEQ